MNNENQKSTINDNEPTNISLKILDAQKNILDKAHNSRIQFHPFTYFYYHLQGSGRYSIESKVIDFNEGDLIIINSNIGHSIFFDEKSDRIKTIGFGIESISITRVNQKEEFENINYYHIDNSNKALKFEPIFESIVNEYKSNNLFARSMANAQATELLINLLRKYRNEISIKHDKKVNRQIDYIKSYMDANYHEDIALEDLSTMAYMNKFHLISEFKQSYRITPIEYLILKRIEVAKNLLISTNHSMEEISDMVGFNSQSYFNQVFKKKVGETPSQFRKKHRL